VIELALVSLVLATEPPGASVSPAVSARHYVRIPSGSSKDRPAGDDSPLLTSSPDARASPTPEDLEATLRRATNAGKLGRLSVRRAELERAVQIASSSRAAAPDAARVRELGARAACELAAERQAVADAIPIGGSGEAFARSLKARAAATTQVTRAAEQCLAFHAPETAVAGAVLAAEALAHLAAALVATPTPPEVKRLGDEAVAAFEGVLAEQAAPLCQRAVEAFDVALSSPDARPDDAAMLERARAGRRSCVPLAGSTP
jgi:hypothetical protein